MRVGSRCLLLHTREYTQIHQPCTEKECTRNAIPEIVSNVANNFRVPMYVRYIGGRVCCVTQNTAVRPIYARFDSIPGHRHDTRDLVLLLLAK